MTFQPEKWKNLLDAMLERTLIAQCTNSNYDGDIKCQGDKVTCKNDIPLIIDQQKFFAFKASNIDKIQASVAIMFAHLQNASKAIEQVCEQYLFSLHSHVSVKNTIGSYNEPIKLDKGTLYGHFVNLALKLKRDSNSAQRPWVIINPLIESNLLQTEEFICEQNIADCTLREDAIGRIAGMDVLVSTNLKEVDGKCYILAGTNEAITFAGELAIIESLYDRDAFDDLVRGLYLFGAKVVEPDALAKMVVEI